MIFLDLGMPIKDGYEACEAIIRHYDKQIGKIKSRTGWLSDLKMVLSSYLGSKNEIIQLDDYKANMEQTERLLVLFKKFYMKVIFHTLD